VYVDVLHSILMLAVIGIWLYSMNRTMQYYEAEASLWRMKKGLPDNEKPFDRDELIRRIKERGGKSNAETNLEEMLNNPRRAIIHMSLMVSLTFPRWITQHGQDTGYEVWTDHGQNLTFSKWNISPPWGSFGSG